MQKAEAAQKETREVRASAEYRRKEYESRRGYLTFPGEVVVPVKTYVDYEWWRYIYSDLYRPQAYNVHTCEPCKRRHLW